jgi:hypothetical protein
MTIDAELVIKRRKKTFEEAIEGYLGSKEFKAVVQMARLEFVKRARRGLMPDLSKIPSLSDEYVETRKRFKNDLSEFTKPKKSNATATGQMLEAMVYEVTKLGFILYIKDSSRTRMFGGTKSKLNNAEVAKYYNKNRKIFELSAPEEERIRRKIRTDLLKLMRQK